MIERKQTPFRFARELLRDPVGYLSSPEHGFVYVKTKRPDNEHIVQIHKRKIPPRPITMKDSDGIIAWVEHLGQITTAEIKLKDDLQVGLSLRAIGLIAGAAAVGIGAGWFGSGAALRVFSRSKQRNSGF